MHFSERRSAMIIKGKSRSNGVQLGSYLMHSEENESVHVLEVSGLGTIDVCEALIQMQEITDSGQRGTKGLYHGVISPQPGYAMDEKQWITAANTLATELKLENQPRVIVLHEKSDRIHAHVVFQRTDKETLTLVPDGWNYVAHEKASRALENLWDHEIIPGAHVEPKKGKDEKSRTSEHDRHQAASSGMSREDRVQQITNLYRQSDGAGAFVSALDQSGYIVARGDRRDFVIVDEGNRVFSLPRYIEGVKTKDVRKFMKNIELGTLPSVEVAKAIASDRKCKEAQHNVLSASKEFEKAKSQKTKDSQNSESRKKMKSKARSALGKVASSQSWERYTEALKTRISNTRSVAKNLRERLGERFKAIAEKAKKYLERSGLRTGKDGSSKGQGISVSQEFNKSTETKVQKAKRKIEHVKSRGPEHDR